MPEDVGKEIDLPATVARHAAQVLRLRIGDPVTLFDGRGGEYAATLSRIGKDGVAARVLRFEPIERETDHAVTLVQSVIAAEMMDLVVRKAVELGAAAVVPVVAERSQRIPDDRIGKRITHWRHIATAACEQCGRNRVPPIAQLAPLSTWIDTRPPGDAALILAPDADRSIVEVGLDAPPRFVLVGPEGGFTADELDRAAASGIRPAHLGPRVLRAETAALAALIAVATIHAMRGQGS